jgi:DNA-directed RNA polymerase II subunit RPB2
MGLSRATKTESPSLQIILAQGQQPIPFVTFIRALGITKAKDIYTLFRFVARDRWSKKYKKLFKDTLKHNQGIISRQAALARIGGTVIPLSQPGANSAAVAQPLSSSSLEEKEDEGKEKKEKEKNNNNAASKVAMLEDYGLNHLRNKFLPNMGNMPEDDRNKIFALCDFGCRLFDYAQNSALRTNKDSYGNKRTESCEDLFGPQGRQLLVSYINNIKSNMLRKLKENKAIDVHDIFADDKVGKGLKELLASGLWHVTKGKATQTGVSGKFDRSNYIATHAQHMKVINQLRKEVKQISPRLLPSTAYGTVCPSDSPEGATCGLVKFNSILQHQSIGTSGQTIINLLLSKEKGQLGAVDIRGVSIEDMRNSVEVLKKRLAGKQGKGKNNNNNNENWHQPVLINVNGCPVAIHDDPEEVAEFVRGKRREFSISRDTGVSYDHLSVDIRTDRGRNMRPLFVAKNLYKLAPTATKVVAGEEKEEEKVKPMNAAAKIAAALGRKQESKYSWQSLLAQGIVEYVDKEEEQNLLIAIDLKNFTEGPGAWPKTANAPAGTTPNTTSTTTSISATPVRKGGKGGLVPLYYGHIEIHGSVFYGVSASLIPFPDHNQSPRNTYQCAMIRQAQGIASSTAKNHRMDPSFMEMWYAQRPLVETQIHKILNCQKFPYGQNVMVAVCSMGGNNQEDASISNKAAIDFGMLRSSIYRTVTISEKRQGKSENSEEFRRVDENNLAGRKKANYSFIEEDGLAAVGSPAELSTVIAQKAVKQKDSFISKECPLEWRDMSVTNPNDTTGRIDRVSITSTACGIRTAKIRIVRVATTREGDKFATRYGQKGVNGESRALVDMIYTEDGIVPHFVINALAFSSRMTWGEWLETLLATAAIKHGKFGDATAFSRQYRDALRSDLEEDYAHLIDDSDPFGDGQLYVKEDAHLVDEICQALANMNLDCNGEHVMYSGQTGDRLVGRIFMGWTYLQKLKHMVKDKIRARGRGRTQALTRQPAENKSNGGGLRVGEMEKDCLASMGAAFNIQDRLCFSSDPQYLHICRKCNNTVIYEESCEKIYCKFCNEYDSSSVILGASGFRLFMQELQACNITVKFDIEPV